MIPFANEGNGYLYHQRPTGAFRNSIKEPRNIDEIIAQHLESPGTKAYTKPQVEKLFSGFDDLKIHTIVTPYDLRYWRDKYNQDRFLPAIIGKITPQYLGWYIIVKGKKRCAEY